MAGKKTIGYTIKPGKDTALPLIIAPDTLCSLQVAEANKDKSELILCSDADGQVVFYVHSSDQINDNVELLLSYKVDEKEVQQVIALRVSDEAINGMPFPKPLKPTPVKSTDIVRPALTKEEMLSLTNKELLSRGYPMRPDPKQSPSAFSIWKQSVGQSSVLAGAHSIPHPYLSAMPTASNVSETWCGYMSLGSPGTSTYNLVNGAWYVPKVVATRIGVKNSVIWVGLDNKDPTLIQAGTGQDTLVAVVGSGRLSITNYYPWYEFLPLQPTIQLISGLSIRPGDLVHVHVWVGNYKKPVQKRRPVLPFPRLSGHTCIFYIENITTGRFVIESVRRGDLVIAGVKAEWITERPLILSRGRFTTSRLAHFERFRMSAACAHNVGGGFTNYEAGVNTIQYTMINPVTFEPLSTVAPIDASTMEFQWIATE